MITGWATHPSPSTPTARPRSAAATPVAPDSPTPLDRVRSALARVTSRRVVGWVLVVCWVGWLAALWVTQPRIVPQDYLADELAQGHATAYRVVTVDEDPAGFWSPYRIGVYPASDAQDGVVDGAADGQQVTVAYWVDAPVAELECSTPTASRPTPRPPWSRASRPPGSPRPMRAPSTAACRQIG